MREKDLEAAKAEMSITGSPEALKQLDEYCTAVNDDISAAYIDMLEKNMPEENIRKKRSN